MKKLVLIEVTDFHDECLYSQIQYLQQKEINIVLICNKKLKKRVQSFDGVNEFIYIDLDSKLKKYLSWIQIWLYLINNNVSKVIFNTAESYIYKLLLFPIPKKIELIGTIHNADKLRHNKKQQKISTKIHKYLTLGDFITHQIKKEQLTTNPVTSYYPIFFPEYQNTIKKSEHEIWITIPGGLEFEKRDYPILNNLKVPSHVKIIILGKPYIPEAVQFISDLKQSENKDNFIYFEDFIPVDIFHDYIKNSDYILPLTHPTNGHFEKFLKYKITGSYNLAFGYKIPMLMEKSFSKIEDFKDSSIFYDYQNINSIFKLIANDQNSYYTSDKWNFECQKQNYLDFIFHS